MGLKHAIEREVNQLKLKKEDVRSTQLKGLNTQYFAFWEDARLLECDAIIHHGIDSTQCCGSYD